MKVVMQLMNGKSFIVERAFSISRVGTHTYEFLYWTEVGPNDNFPASSKIRVTEVISLAIDYTCQCHSEIELIEHCSVCGCDTANPCGCVAD
jgi:hypothetical protein